mgnify:CR=1 FL=1
MGRFTRPRTRRLVVGFDRYCVGVVDVTTTTTLPAKLLYTVYFTTNPRRMTGDGKDEVAAAAEAIKARCDGKTGVVMENRIYSIQKPYLHFSTPRAISVTTSLSDTQIRSMIRARP